MRGDKSGKINSSRVKNTINGDSNKLKFLYTNADMLTNKMPEFKLLINTEDPDIIFINEVKPKNYKENICEVLFNVEGYNLISTNIENRTGRGAIMYVRKEINFTEYIPKTNYTESLWIRMDLERDGQAIVGGVYRSNQGTNENNVNLINLIKEVSDLKPNYLVILGDFNYGHVDWLNLVPTPDRDFDSDEGRFVECVKDCFLYQHILEPTRARLHNNPNILDLLFTNEEGAVDNLMYQSPLGKSDHCVLKFDFMLGNVKKDSLVPKLNYKKANFKRMGEYLQKVNWGEELYILTDTEEMWDMIKGKIIWAIENYTPEFRPFVNNTGRNFKMKLEGKILQKRKDKNAAWRKYMRTRSEDDYRKYTRLRNKLRNMTRGAHKRVEKSVVMEAKSNPKKFWRYVNSKTKTRGVIPELKINDQGDTTKSDMEKAETLSKFFSSVYTPETNEDLPEFDVPNLTEDMQLVDIMESEVENKLNNLKVTKSSGPDNIPSRVLFELRNELVCPLTFLFNSSIKYGHVPHDWKCANVSPIYKKGMKSKAENYRPVSLTPILCKMLESLVKDKIMVYMLDKDLFSNRQFGFISGRSTCLQLLKVIEDWTDIMDKGGQIDCVYFDFMKAFDKVSHRHLIGKLKAYKLNTKIIDWIKSFLTLRKQRVVVAGSKSNWTAVTSGIPQGSVLGPVFFVIYINDLPQHIKSNAYIFADDTKIYRQILTDSDNKVLQEDIRSLEKWADTWELKFHPAKCKYMTIGKPKQNDFNYKMAEGVNEVVLEKVKTEKDLGVTFDEKLDFGIHIAEKVKKANQILGLIRRAFIFLDEQSMITLYKSMVRPHLEFSQIVWSPYLLKYVDLIERVQRRATKLIPGYENLTYEERLRRTKLPSLTYRRLRGDMIETYKIGKNIYDPRVADNILTYTEYDGTRGNSEKLFHKRCNLNVRKNVFSIRVAKLWNRLPQSVINATSIKMFEHRYDKFMAGQPILYDYRKDLQF